MGSAFNRIDEQRRYLHQFKDSVTAHPFLSISFGLYWMQTMLLFQSFSQFLSISPLTPYGLPQGTLVISASVITYATWSLLFRRANTISQASWFPIVLCIGLTLGALLYGLCPLLMDAHSDLAFAAYLTGSILVGCGTANICLETGRLFGYLGPLQVLFHGIAALLMGTIGALVLSLFPTTVSIAAIVALPIPMVACLWKSIGSVSRSKLYGQGLNTKVHIPKKFLITSLFQGFALGVMHNLLASSIGASTLAVSVGYFAAVALLFFCAIAVKNNFDVLIYRIGFPLMSGGFFIVGMAQEPLLTGALFLDIGYCFQYLMTCSLCAYLAKGLGQPPVWIIGTGTGCLLGGQLLGDALSAVTPDTTALTLSVAFFLLLAALFMTSSQNLRRGWGAISPGSEEAEFDDGGKRTLARRMLASEHGLSKRETEVFDLVVRGYSRKAMGHELHLAEETVKTHTGRIYQKFLVHSKQELIELVNQRAEALGR